MPKTPGSSGLPPEQRKAQAQTAEQERWKKEVARWKGLFLSQIQTVTLDKTIRIKSIPPGEESPGAWFYHPKEHTIYFSEKELFERLEKYGEEHVLGIMSHEAAHAIISDFQFVPESVLEREIGLSSTLHATEERPTDFLVQFRAPVAYDWVCDMRRALLEEGSERSLTHEEILIMRGWYPRFGDLSNIIVFDPYSDAPFDKATPEAQDAYEAIREAMHHIERMVPKHEIEFPQARKLALAKKRYKAVYREVLPHVRELVEYDRDSGYMHEAAKHILAIMIQEQETKNIVSDMSDGDAQVLESLQALFAPSSAVSTGEEDLLSPELESELLEKMKDAAERKAQFVEKKKQESEQAVGAIHESPDEENPAAPVTVEVGAEDHELYLAAIADLMDRIGGIEKAPLPVDELSPELQDRLLELFEQFKKQQQQLIKQIVEKVLKELDGKIGASFQKDTGGVPMPPGEGPAVPAEGQNDEPPPSSKETEEEIERIERQIEAENNADQYHQHYQEVHDQIDTLSQKLYELFRPSRNNKKQLRRTGSTPNLPAVFKSTAARRAGAAVVEDRIFETKEIPQKSDVEFVISVDMSGSMGGERIEQTFKGVVLIAETLNKLGIKFAVDGFCSKFDSRQGTYRDNDPKVNPDTLDDSFVVESEERSYLVNIVQEFKGSAETLNDDLRAKMLNILKLGAGTPTHLGVKNANKHLAQSDAQHRFILVLTDGAENDSQKLQTAINEAEQAGNQPIGIGLGKNMDKVKRSFPASIANIDFADLPDVLAALLYDMIENPHKYKTTT